MLEAKMNQLLLYYSDYAKILNRRMIGCEEMIRKLFIALMIQGNILLEGPPGVGKTTLVKQFAEYLTLSYSRIQFTPDLMPLDIIGSNILQQGEDGDRTFEFYKGPIFANIILGDEINRATPKTQSALLEAMDEKTVTFLGTEYPLPVPFMVIATQNPIELEGTYPLPEAQIDRFLMKLFITYPNFSSLKRIINTNEKLEKTKKSSNKSNKIIFDCKSLENDVVVLEDIKSFITRLVVSTHPAHTDVPAVKKYVLYGASPRAGIALLRAAKWNALLDNRINVSFDDIKNLAFDILNHRIILNFEGESEYVDPRSLISSIVQKSDQKIRA